MLRSWLSFSILAILSFLSDGLRADGPEFRGPAAQGHSTESNLPTEWTSTKNVTWKQPIPGKGWSSPAVVANSVYLTTAVAAADGSSLSLQALCLDSETGALKWTTELFVVDTSKRLQIHGKNSHASPSPVVGQNRLFVHFGSQGTACLDLNGRVLWKNSGIRYEPVHGGGGSPLLVDDLLIFSCDGASDPFLVALNTRDGSVQWRVKRTTDAQRTFSFATPLLIEVNGQRQIISPGSNMLGAYHPETGRELWKLRFDGYSVIPRPVFGLGLLFIGTGYDRPSVLAVRPDGAGDVTATHLAWTVQRGAQNTPSLLLVGEELYMLSDSGMASCLEARTGKTHWQERIGGNCSASPIFADGKIYFQNEEGLGVVIRPGKVFDKVASNPLNERTLASYAVSQGALFIRGEQHLFRIGTDGSK